MSSNYPIRFYGRDNKIEFTDIEWRRIRDLSSLHMGNSSILLRTLSSILS